ncbi:MAG: CopG family transcriptional regulator [Acidimicrobiia bacterium]
MRTTIDLPADLHDLARQLAHEGNRSMSEVIAELIRLGLRRESNSPPTSGPRGMPQVSIGRPVTMEDVRSLDDDA